MKIRFSVKINLNIICRKKEDCFLECNFTYSGNKVRLKGKGEIESTKSEELQKIAPFIFAIKIIDYEVSLSKKTKKIDEKELSRLGKLAVAIHNNVIKSLRQFSEATYLNPINLKEKFLNVDLDNISLRVEKGDGKYYKPYKQPTLQEALLNNWQYQKESYIYKNSLPLALEALEDNLPNSIETELKVRAYEYLDSDVRSALLESIMCLEVVVSQYLRNYLSDKYPNLSKKGLDNFLSPQLGLTQRVSVLLKMTVHKSYLDKIRIDKVLYAVKARNKIIHKGLLDVEGTYSEIKEAIREVLKLCDSLIMANMQIDYTPLKKAILSEFKKKFGNIWLSLWIYNNHNILAQVTLFFSDKKDKDSLVKMVNQLKDSIKEVEKRFNEKEHLTVIFKGFLKGEEYGIWKGGDFLTV